MTRWPKVCRVCGAAYSREQWPTLAPTGTGDGIVIWDGSILRHRQCASPGCRSTLVVDEGPTVAATLVRVGRALRGEVIQ
jgi:hypothetical protein